MAKGDHTHKAGGWAGAGHQKGTSAALAKTQQSWEKHGDRFPAMPHWCLFCYYIGKAKHTPAVLLGWVISGL